MAGSKDIASAILDIVGENDEESTVKRFLDTGYPPFNHALSASKDGGLPCGRMIEIAGPPSSGKTAIATAAMADAQKKGGIAAFMDHERSFSLRLAPHLGLDVEAGTFIYKKPKTFEESLEICIKTVKAVRGRKIIPDEAPICWVFDSLAAMVPQSAYFDSNGKDEKDPSKRSMNDNTALARATSAHFPLLAQIAEDYNVCIIFLNQTRTNIGIMYGDKTTTPGGDASKFYFSVRVMLSAKKVVKGQGADKEVLGSMITANVIKNKVARPWQTSTWKFIFNKDGTGHFDVVGSMIDFLAENKIIKQSGARYEWKGKSLFRSQVIDTINENKEVDELLALMPKDYEPPTIEFTEDEKE